MYRDKIAYQTKKSKSIYFVSIHTTMCNRYFLNIMLSIHYLLYSWDLKWESGIWNDITEVSIKQSWTIYDQSYHIVLLPRA